MYTRRDVCVFKRLKLPTYLLKGVKHKGSINVSPDFESVSFSRLVNPSGRENSTPD